MATTINEVLAALGRSAHGITFASRTPQHVTYAELGARIRGNARHFAAQGIARGDRVAIAMDNDLEHVVALLALMAMGAVPLSVKPRRGSVDAYDKHLRELCARYAVRRAYGSLPGAELQWSPDARSDDAAAVVEVAPHDVAFVQFSSGSLGDPKAVPIRHAMLIENLRAQAATDGRTGELAGYNFLPLSHDMGLVGGLFGALLMQHTFTLSSVQEFLRRPVEVFRRHEHERSLIVPMPDFALRYLARHLSRRPVEPRLLASARTIYCGAEPIRRSTIAELLDVAPAFGFDPRALVFSYGLAEATLLVTAHMFESLDASFTEGPRVIANVGKPSDPRLELMIAGGGEGPIVIRGPSVFTGYLDAAPLTDGWYDTGDVGFLRDGDLFISGRTKDLLIVNGENIFPSDIEELVAAVPGVDQALVMTEDDRFFVLVVPSSAKVGADAGPIADAIAARFGTAPVAIAVGPAGAILRTTSGKPQRAATLAELRRTGLL